MPRDTARWVARAATVAFVAYAAATLVYVGWIVAHEPFAFDAWNIALDTHAQPFTVPRWLHYYWYEYTHSNPRFGQALTYLAYKLDDFATLATPIAFAALSLAISVLGLGRFPRVTRGRDAALATLAIGCLWFALPELPRTMFCRAYSANYVYGAAIQLWFLAVMRLVPDGRAPSSACVGYAMFGLIAGACNEHSGPTLAAFMLGYAWWTQRRTGAVPTLAWAGAIGATLGFAWIFFAPGQGERYEGLAQRVSLFGRLEQRGIAGNLDILRELLIGAAPVLAMIAIVLILSVGSSREPNESEATARRQAVRGIAGAMIAAVAMAATIFVSPKLGTRFYLLSCALLFAGFLALADAVLVTRRRLAPFVIVALFASGYAVARTVLIYPHVAREGAARLAALEAAKPGTAFVAEGFDQVEDSWWYIGDDFRDGKKRDLVANYFGLSHVVYQAYDVTAPLGVTSAKFVPHYTIDPPSCIDEHGWFALGPYRGLDLVGIHREARTAIDLLRERIGSAGVLQQLDLAVELDDPEVAFPRPRLLVARWLPDRFVGYEGEIVRKGAGKTRDVVLPKELVGQDRDIYIYRVGGEAKPLGNARGGPLQYVPWTTGVYWALACDANECFVIAATRQSA
jgi:hypothetical protein